MVLYVLDAAAQDDVRATVVVIGHHATWVEKALTEGARPGYPLTFVEQSEQLGTAHAVRVALSTLDDAIGDDRRRRPHHARRHAAAAALDRGTPLVGAP